MRWSALSQLLTIGLATFALAAPSDGLSRRSPEPREEGSDKVEKDSFGRPIKPSVFNGVEVPPLEELDGEQLDKIAGKGYWLLEFFSPYCGHCQDFAPTLQTFYELYYTSEALPSAADQAGDVDLSFTKYYDFHFGRINCAAFGATCKDREIGSFPTLALFKDNKFVKKQVGGKSIENLSEWLEEVLETIKPGSRPKKGLKELPKVGDDHIAGAIEATSKHKNAGTTKADDPVLLEKEIEDELDEESPKSKSKSKGKGKSRSSSKGGRKKQEVLKAEINPSGKSIPLTAETFQSKVTTTRDSWFVKFYAPWCPHCQHLAPSWQAMARDMGGKLNIGEVNCDVEKRLCKDVHVKGYPTLIFFQGGERIEFEGLRGLGDLLDFANKAVAAGEGVKEVDFAQFEELEKTEEVIFLYLYDHATTSEDFQALERLTLSLIGKARLIKSNDEKLYKRFKVSTWPRLLVSRDGKPTYYEPFAPQDMRNYRKVLDWMQKVWQPIVPELTSANAKEIMANKLVVLGILSRQRADEFVIAKREIKNAALEWIDKQTQAFQLERQELRDAKQLRIEEAEDRNDQRGLRNAKSIRINMDDIERKEVAFAWVDGAFWERWIKTTYGINVKDGERVVVNDEENHRYWDTTITGNPIVPSRTSILETLPKIVANPPKLSPKSTASFLGHFYYSLRHAFISRPLLSSGALLMLVVVIIWSVRSARRGGGGGAGHLGGNGYGANGGLNGNAPFQEKKGWGNTGGFFQLPVNSKDGGILGNGMGEKAD